VVEALLCACTMKGMYLRYGQDRDMSRVWRISTTLRCKRRWRRVSRVEKFPLVDVDVKDCVQAVRGERLDTMMRAYSIMLCLIIKEWKWCLNCEASKLEDDRPSISFDRNSIALRSC